MRILAAVLLAGLIAVTAGCGGGKKSPSSAEAPAGSTSVTLTSTTSGGSGSAPSFASAKNCQDLAGIAAKAASAITSTGGNPSAALDTEANVLQKLAAAAPPDIRDDFKTMATAFTGFVDALRKAGYKAGSTTAPSAGQVATLTKAAKSFDTPKIRAAEQHLNAWAKRNCQGVHVGG